jgi:kinesin family member 6/9
MSGGDTWNQRGIVPRVFSSLFEEIRKRKDTMHYNVYISYFEIYNECGYDLLDRKHAEMPFDKWNKITLYEDSNQNLHLKNLTIHPCNSEQDAIDLLMMGNFIRQVSATPMNPASSRSHCIFTIAIESRDLDSDVVRMSKLHLVDLAGSERVFKKMGVSSSMSSQFDHHGETQVTIEARYINRSLSYLE